MTSPPDADEAKAGRAVADGGYLLFLAGDFPPDVGGIQRYACELVRALLRRGVRCLVLAPRRPGAEAVDQGLLCPVRRVSGKAKAGLGLSMAWALRAWARHERPLAVVATKWMPEGPAYLLAGGRKLGPLALLGHGREFLPEAGRPVRAWLQRRVLRAARWCLANSTYTAGNFQRAGVPADRIRVLYGGVDPSALEADPRAGEELRRREGLGRAPLLLSVSRLVCRKGHDLVMQALPAVAQRLPGVKYAVVGDGPEEARLRTMAEELGLADRVIFAGRVSDRDLRAWYAACDVFVMPSRDLPDEPPEGLGLAYLEANAAGKPVVGARTGGTADAVADGESGLLVRPDDVEDLTRALLKLLTDQELARKLGEAGRQRVLRDFTWDAVAGRFLAALGLDELL